MENAPDPDRNATVAPASSRSGAHFWITAPLITLFCILLGASFLFPTYIDDVLSPLIASRGGYDGWATVNAFPQCGSLNFAVPIPPALLPGRGLAWLVHAATGGFFTMRLISIALLLSWVAFTAWFIKSCALPGQPYVVIVAGIIGFVGTGTLPFALLVNRPEPAMLFAITVYASLPFLAERYPAQSRCFLLSVVLLFCLLTSWFISSHPKALFYAPLVLASAFCVRRWGKTTSMALLAFTLFAIYQALYYWMAKIACPASPEVRKYLDSEAIAPAMLLQNGREVFIQLIHNIFNGPTYIADFLFSGGGYWLPPAANTLVDNISNILILIVMLSLLVWACKRVPLVANNVVAGHGWKSFPFILSLCLLLAFAAQWLVQNDKIFYNAALVWTTLLLSGGLLAIYLLKHTNYWRGKEQWLALRYSCLCLVSALSLCGFLLTYIPAALDALLMAGRGGRIGNERLIMSPLHYGVEKSRTKEAAAQCHIKPDGSSRHVGVDTRTYMAMKNTYQPLILFPKSRELEEPQPQRLLVFLHEWHSSGLITRCDMLRTNARMLAKEFEGVCCLSAEQISSFVPEPR